MLDLGYEILLIYEKIKIFLKPEILTMIVLLLILARTKVINLVLILTGKILNVEKEDILKFPTRYLKSFFLLTGLYFIFLIWYKNPEGIKNVRTIYKIIAIFIIAKTIINIINPEGVIIKAIDNNENIKLKVEILTNTFIFNIIKYVIYIIAIFIIITDMGYNINGLVAGLGIGSAIIALAVQDLVKSVISGATIISEKPFSIGDSIQIGEYIGTVENITLRNTVIRLKNNALMSIPNLMITTEYVINFDKIENRRIENNIFLDFDTEEEKIRRVLAKVNNILKNDSKVIRETIVTRFENISQEGLKLMIYCYITDYEYSKFLNVKENLNYKIMEILKTENLRPLYTVNQVKMTEPIKQTEEKRYIEED